MFVVLLSFKESLIRDQAKCLFINDKICMIRPTFIVLNPFELKFYPYMISLDKCTGNCKILSLKTQVVKERKNLNVKAFSIITNKNETKAMVEHISCNCKCQFKSTTCNSNQNWNNKICKC